MRRTALGLLVLAFVVACARPRTQLVVEVDSDIDWGQSATLRAVQITVRSGGPAGETRDQRTLSLGRAVSLPATFGVFPLDGDATRTVWIEVRGCGVTGCDAPIVTQRAQVGFVEGQTMLLRMTLARVCQMVSCADPLEACRPETQRCEAARVDVATLPVFGGGSPRDAAVMDAEASVLDVAETEDAADVVKALDASEDDAADVSSDGGADVDDASGCAPAQTACDGVCVDLQRSAAHCGECGHACVTARANSEALCTAGACAVRCREGYADCDGNPATGCEAQTTADARHCGMCGNACPVRANASVVCVDGACGFTCATGFESCDGDPANGCEADTRNSATDCGRCGAMCMAPNSTGACAAGVCGIGSCATGWGDCDGDASSGCERDLLTSIDHCGACAARCAPSHATGACMSGRCAVASCAAGWGDCDGRPDNGCERAGGCGCTVGATESCYGGPTGTLGLGACRAGTRRCVDSGGSVGVWDACSGEVAPGTEVCNGRDDDCDGMTDETATMCAARANATASCAGGACAYACGAGWGDCDGNAANGCEADVRSNVASCGRCGNACAAGSYCESGACRAPMVRHVFSFGAPTSPPYPRAGRRIGLDAAGNLYVVVAGLSSDFGGEPGVTLFLVSFSSTGVRRWTRSLPGASSSMAAMAVSPAGDVTIAVNGTNLDLGQGVRSGGGAHLASYSSENVPRWARYIGTGNVLDLDADAAGNVYLVGSNGRWDLGDPAGGPVDNFITGSLTSTGGYRWSNTGRASRIAVDTVRGEPCVVYADGGSLTIRCYDTLGGVRWMRSFSGAADPQASLAVSPTGTVAWAGPLWNTIDCGRGLIGTAGGRTSIAVAVWQRDGMTLWSRGYESGENWGATPVALDAYDNLYLAGYSATNNTFGTGLLGLNATFIVSLTATGSGRWSRVLHTYGRTASPMVDMVVLGRDLAALANIARYQAGVDFGGGVVGESGTNADGYAVGRMTQ